MKKRIVIAGFGDTGLLTAIHLSDGFEVIGISPKPCLVSGQELGTRLTRPAQWKDNYLMPFDRFKRLRAVRTLQGLITHVDVQNQTLTWQDATGQPQQLTYDALLISTGVSNGFWRNNRLESLQEVEQQLQLRHQTIDAAQRIAVVGGGASAVSVCANIKERFPAKDVHLFHSQTQPLPMYHPRTRKRVGQLLHAVGVQLHPGCRAVLPDTAMGDAFTTQALSFENAESDFKADLCIWAVGNLRPHNAGLPQAFLNAQGFVKVDEYLRVPGAENVFAVGDIAATDPNRCSARNKGFAIAAHNIAATLNGAGRLKAFKPARYRWGSILGVREEGMRVFTPKGRNVRIRRWLVDKLLFPVAVHRMIYKGVSKQ